MKTIKKNIATVLVLPILIFIANTVLVWPLFQGGYTQFIGSIESVFIADAQFILDNFPDLSWNPYWYTGFSFHLFYTPLLPVLMVVAHVLAPVTSLASWYRIFIGLFYALTPVSLYFLARFLTGRSLFGLLTALFFSFLPSLAYFVLPVGGAAAGFGQPPWRLVTLIVFGEGGHIVGLFFIPLALLFFTKAVRKASFKNVFLASLLIGLLALSNMIALIGFTVMAAVILLSELADGEWPKKIGRAGVVFLYTVGLVSFWFNLSFVNASFSIGTGGVEGGVGGTYLRSLPLFLLLVPVFFFFSTIVRRKGIKIPFIAGAWVLIFYISARFWFYGQTMLLPQPNRYLLEMGMGVALLAAWIVFFLVDALFKKHDVIKLVLISFAILVVIPFPFRYFDQVRELVAPHKDIQDTSEYRIVSWFQENTQGERVYATGTSAFWLNTFPEAKQIPQVRGGNDGVANPWVLHAVYQINTGENAPEGQGGRVATWWLRVLNVSYLVVNTPSSEETFHDYRNLERFSNMEQVADLRGDVIYKIPLDQPSLAQVVSKNTFASLEIMKNAVDVDKLEAYVDYIDQEEQKNTAEFAWVGNGRAEIKTTLEKGEGIGVQVSYDPGWKAYLGGKQIPIKSDVIGFMFLDPGEVSGEVEIDLVYGWTWDVWMGYLLTLLTFGALVFYSRFSGKVSSLFQKTEKKWEDDDE